MFLENLSVLRAFAVKMTFCCEVTDALRELVVHNRAKHKADPVERVG